MPLIEQLTASVYLIEGYSHSQSRQPNIGVVVAQDQTILIDAGNGLRRARQVAMELVTIGLPPVRTLIYTHHHWDHVSGAQVYHANTIIAHDSCHTALQAWANKPLSGMDALRQLYHEGDSQSLSSSDLREFRLCLPTLTFSSRLRLSLSGLHLELSHVGGTHAADSLVVSVVDQGVMFIGDCALDSEHQPNAEWVERFCQGDVEWLIDGHTSRYRAAEWRAWLGRR